MSLSGVARFGFPALMIVIWVALQGTSVQAQQRGGTVQTDKVAPVNSGANPYGVVGDWARLSKPRPWGGSNGVAIGRDAKAVGATSRSSPGSPPGCPATKGTPARQLCVQG